jgi:alpha-beta hydrolase superfamily lysophospholipase
MTARSLLFGVITFAGLAQAQSGGSYLQFDASAERVFLHHQAASAPPKRLPVLILHGATFPTQNAAGWKIDGISWMDDLSAVGYEVYGLDFLGFGRSVQKAPYAAHADELDRITLQLSAAVREIKRQQNAAQIHLIAHSAGTLIAGFYAQSHARELASLTLFGAPIPVAKSQLLDPSSNQDAATYFLMSANDQWLSFEDKVRASQLDQQMFAQWAQSYLSSDLTQLQRQPPSVRVPNTLAGILHIAKQSGVLPYNPANIQTPTLVIQGQWDQVTSPAVGRKLFDAIAAQHKSFVVMPKAGHRMHLEKRRLAFFARVRRFLAATEGAAP